MEQNKIKITASALPSAVGVKGKTIIDHKIRLTLKLSTAEYCFMDLVYNHNKEFSEKPITYADFYDKIGMSKEVADVSYDHLRNLQLIVIEKGRLITTQPWNDFFDKVTEGDFEVLWKLKPNGNKQKAKIAYEKCRKLVEADVLLDAYKKYLAFIDHKGQFQLHVATWLNPASRSWEDDYTIVLEPKENEKSNIQPGDFLS